jgi:PAS domain S-box-containing protein
MHDPQHLVSMLDALPTAVTSVDLHGKLLFVNQAAARRFSRGREGVIGTSIYEHFPTVATVLRERIRQTVSRGTAQRFETALDASDGAEQIFESTYFLRIPT